MNFNFKQMVESLRDTGYPAEPDRVRIKVVNAEARLRAGLDYFTGKGVWNEENYRPVVEWLEDNKGRGLLINGGCGVRSPYFSSKCGMSRFVVRIRSLPFISAKSHNSMKGMRLLP